MKRTARITIRPIVYRGSVGFSVRGTSWRGQEDQKIFVFTKEAAEQTKQYLKTGRGHIVFGTPEGI